MSSKARSIYFFIFAILYVVYVLALVKHGIDLTNSMVTLGLFLTSGYYYLKYRKEQ